MKKIVNPLKLVIGILGLSSVAALVGSISGTIAWYAYSTRALVSYNGTSVSSTTQLQIGIKSDVQINKYTDENFSLRDITEHVQFAGDTNHYYFMKVGSGGMPAAFINAYLEEKGYATNILEPLSSYGYETGDDIDLRNRPTTNKPEIVPSAAEITKYVYIPFVFRVISNTTNNIEYVDNHEIFLTEAKAVAASDGQYINESIRLYIDRTNGDNYILNPNKTSNGSTKVAGVLDLSDDGLFDYDSYTNREYIYGDYDIEDNYDLDDCYMPGLANTSDLVDINGSGITNEATTFTSRHYKGIEYFAGIEDNHIIPHLAKYLGTHTIAQKTAGLWGGDYAVCKTDENNHHLGTFNMTVYLEGWDFSVIDKELTHEFNLGLTFEINPVV